MQTFLNTDESMKSFYSHHHLSQQVITPAQLTCGIRGETYLFMHVYFYSKVWNLDVFSFLFLRMTHSVDQKRQQRHIQRPVHTNNNNYKYNDKHIRIASTLLDDIIHLL